jgi:hypothetical protein
MATSRKGNVKAKAVPEHGDNRLRYVYTDAAGNNYFEFIHDAAMPYKRYVDAQVTEKMVRLGFSQTGIEEIIAVCKKLSVDGGRTAEQLRQDLLTVGANLEGRLGYLTSHRVYEQYASIFYLLEDEPVVPSDRWYLKKMDLWANDEQARDFFLLGAYKKIHGLANISVNDMMLSFKAGELREQNIANLPKK